ncbi:TAP-like protein-domain-containing protein, partial [Amylocarpus encephaloides]
VTPSSDLRWRRCYEIYDCALLDVPLDYLDPSEELRASIAVIRFNATDRANYKGSIFINPGGPGGSGVWFVKHFATYYQSVVGKNYDIISFDPRGVGFSTPKITCFPTPQSSLMWDLLSLPVLDAHPGILNDAYARAHAFSSQCSSTQPPFPFSQASNFSLPTSYVSTASTAHDLYTLMHANNQTSLKYWGFSYGTYLGAVFASLYPESVGLMVNDGNVDVVQFTDSRGTGFIHDAESVMEAFYTFCHQAGPSRCAFHSTSPSKIKSKLTTLLSAVKRSPVIVASDNPNANSRPQIITYSSIRRLISSSLYRPLVMFPALATVLAALEKGNGAPYLALNPPLSQDPFQCSDSRDGRGGYDAGEDIDIEGNADATLAIMCSDNGGVSESVEDYAEYVDEVLGISPSAGAVMAEMRLGCVGWDAKAKWRFTGPWGSNSTPPILFVANTHDNVTPLRSALVNSAYFPISRLLVQNSYGHTSLSAPSRCTARAIRAYFQSRKLPDEETVCEADLSPFDPWDIQKLGMNSDSSEDGELDEALLKLMSAPIVGHGRYA